MQTVAVAGLGLIGGSFGLALQKAGFTGTIIGVSETPYAEIALNLGAVTEIANLEEACKRADLIYLAQPVDQIISTIRNIGGRLRAGCLVTDSGSTKRAICEEAARSITKATFLGGHPMAGKEKRGIQEAEPDLFQNRIYVLTPTADRHLPFEEEFKEWLARIGSRVQTMSPGAHDQAVAYSSHLPQMLSSALANTISAETGSRIPDVYGPGLLDMTRLALSAPDLWASILQTNSDTITAAIEDFQKQLTALKLAVQSDQLRSLLTNGSEFAATLRKFHYKP